MDGSLASILALRWAQVIASVMNAGIRALTAWDFDIPFGSVTPTVPDPDRQAQRICSLTVERAYGTSSPGKVAQAIRRGPAAKVLLDESLTAQLLILGSRGHSTLSDVLIGSVSTTVGRDAKCPVLIAYGTALPSTLWAHADVEKLPTTDP
ncbi:universal stress family protein [Pseudarthrobacter siccitolerans]|uniref:Universal stress family protein n=1 Tax=Pseudarthrobacter siccitolerans TaxID=861266 RepID=A0A024H2S9_9MICC|nr:universal stress family protein [Pseudarthrobacter siccitolerans]